MSDERADAIPEAAVEAALRAYWFSTRVADSSTTFRDDMRAALAAAAPHMAGSGEAGASDPRRADKQACTDGRSAGRCPAGRRRCGDAAALEGSANGRGRHFTAGGVVAASDHDVTHARRIEMEHFDSRTSAFMARSPIRRLFSPLVSHSTEGSGSV